MMPRALALFVCFAVAAGLVAQAERPEPNAARPTFAFFPQQVGEWFGVDARIDESTLQVLGVDDYLSRAYFTPDRAGIGLYVGYYGGQREGDTIHSPLNCLPGSGWEPVSKSTVTIPIKPGSSGVYAPEIVVNRYLIQKGLERQLVLYWYQSRGRVIASEYWGKFYLIADAVRLNRTDGALVRVISPVLGDEGAE